MLNRAKLGQKHLGLHNDLLEAVSKTLSDIVYDPVLEKEQAEKVIAYVKRLSKALPEIDFFHDKENTRIILKLSKEYQQKMKETDGD